MPVISCIEVVDLTTVLDRRTLLQDLLVALVRARLQSTVRVDLTVVVDQVCKGEGKISNGL